MIQKQQFIVLRESHKGIIIGKSGAMLKKIGTYARQDLEKMFDCKINLKIWVKVKQDWINNENFVKNSKVEINSFKVLFFKFL